DLMFGSEEFPQFINQFTDIAAVFVDGTNYAYFNGDPNQLLHITTGSVGDFYANGNPANVGEAGAGPLSIQYNGISAPLTLTATLGAGTDNPDGTTTHTLKIAIADTNDTAYDSGLFVSNLHIGSDSGGGGIGGPPPGGGPTEDQPVALNI